MGLTPSRLGKIKNITIQSRKLLLYSSHQMIFSDGEGRRKAKNISMHDWAGTTDWFQDISVLTDLYRNCFFLK